MEDKNAKAKGTQQQGAAASGTDRKGAYVPVSHRYTLEERKRKREHYRQLYPNMILVIVEPHKKCAPLLANAVEIELMCSVNKKIVSIPKIIKNRLDLDEKDALFLFCKTSNITTLNQSIADVYEQHRNSDDDILYLQYSTVEIFGHKAEQNG